MADIHWKYVKAESPSHFDTIFNLNNPTTVNTTITALYYDVHPWAFIFWTGFADTAYIKSLVRPLSTGCKQLKYRFETNSIHCSLDTCKQFHSKPFTPPNRLGWFWVRRSSKGWYLSHHQSSILRAYTSSLYLFRSKSFYTHLTERVQIMQAHYPFGQSSLIVVDPLPPIEPLSHFLLHRPDRSCS